MTTIVFDSEMIKKAMFTEDRIFISDDEILLSYKPDKDDIAAFKKCDTEYFEEVFYCKDFLDLPEKIEEKIS